jgi:hypothetical protein
LFYFVLLLRFQPPLLLFYKSSILIFQFKQMEAPHPSTWFSTTESSSTAACTIITPSSSQLTPTHPSPPAARPQPPSFSPPRRRTTPEVLEKRTTAIEWLKSNGFKVWLDQKTFLRNFVSYLFSDGARMVAALPFQQLMDGRIIGAKSNLPLDNFEELQMNGSVLVKPTDNKYPFRNKWYQDFNETRDLEALLELK